MDEKRFDALSRVLGVGVSRRAAMRGLLEGAVLGWLGASSVEASSQKKRRRKNGVGKGGELVCHSNEELRAPRYVVRAILLDGGTRGPCPTGRPPGGPAPPCDVCPACLFTTIQAAVDAARTADVIGLCAGVYRETIDVSARANLRTLAIVGAGPDAGGTVIDGDGNGPVLSIGPEGPALVVERLTITGGMAEQGGGIFTSAQNLTLIDVRVTGNRARLGGGGIFSAGASAGDAASLTLSATDITNNSARVGGGIFNVGQAAILVGNDSTITGNRATQSGGGGGIQNAGGSVDLEDAIVSGNTPANCVGVAGC